MFARTIVRVKRAPAVSSDASDQPGPAIPARPASVPSPAHAVEPVLSGSTHFDDLIALAGPLTAEDRYGDPLLTGYALHAPEDDEHDSTAMCLPGDADASDPLAALTLEYRRALLNQKSGFAHELKTATADGDIPVTAAPQDAFADLTDHPHAEASVLELLTKGKNVDTLLDSLDSFGAGQLFEADEQFEILALLAPHGIPERRAGQAAQLAREEHHMISVDSHMAMPDSTEFDEPESPDESHR